MVDKTLCDIAAQIKEELRDLHLSEKSAVLEARELACFAAGVDRRDYFRLKNENTGRLVYSITDLLELRRAGMPVAYIIGEWDFFGRTFFIDSRALIPRDDSAALIELLLARLVTLTVARAPKILDLCSGSGCLGITAALELEKSIHCVLADISEGALEVSKKNIILHGLTDCVTAVKADVFSPPPDELSGFDAIICNPPYIRSDEIALLDGSVEKYEPRAALDGGEDGLSFYRQIASSWKKALVPGGLLCFEAGIGQAADISEIMRQNGFDKITVQKDLSGVDRALCGRLL